MIALPPGSAPTPSSSIARLRATGNVDAATVSISWRNASLTCIADKKKDSIDLPVPLLDRQPTHCGLAIIGRRLGLDAVTPPIAPDNPVPCPLIPNAWNEDLGRPTEGLMAQGPKVAQQPQLRRVANRLTARVRLHDQVEADHSRHPGQEHDVHMLEDAALKATSSRSRNAHGLADLVQRESAVQASDSNIGADGDSKPPAAFGSTVERSRTRSHVGDVADRRSSGA
jgi:hypothetical protein